MQFNKSVVVRLAFILLPLYSTAQTTYLLRGDKQEILLERLEIKAQRDSVLNFSKTKPYSRKAYVEAVQQYLKSDTNSLRLTPTDVYYMKSLLKNNIEWLPQDLRETYLSQRPIWKKFYKHPADMIATHSKDFDLTINPVLNIGFIKESHNSQQLFYNTRGLTLRGKIANRIGFSATATDNQERYPAYVQEWTTERSAVPGAGYYHNFKGAGGVDYFDARGTVTFAATKYIDIAFGYDRNFIGNGQRSLFLSDFSNNNLFLKLNTRIWKFNYQNLFMELHHAHTLGADNLIGKKYAALHHLDINLTPWLNVGLFEGIVFGRNSRFEFNYLLPVLFYRAIERDNGSRDNGMAGIDFKANVARTAQLYGQFMLDELKVSEITRAKGWWANKWGLQLGAKYIDAFTIKNLDLQVEWNRVRPFTYSHYDSLSNYTHYNQPMAHPLMANFNELLGIARYRPIPRLLAEARLMYYTQGRDSTAAVNFGSNIFLSNNFGRTAEYGYTVGGGWKTDVALANILISYELKENLFLELNGMLRKQRTTTAPLTSKSSTSFSVGLRWNIARRDFWF